MSPYRYRDQQLLELLDNKFNHYTIFDSTWSSKPDYSYGILLKCMAMGHAQGGTLIFFRIRRPGPSIYRSPQKNIRNFKHPKKIFEILATQKNIPILFLDLKKDPKCIEVSLKLAPFCDDPPKISTKSSYPQKIFIFLKTQKILKFRILNPKKWAEPTYV